MLLFDANLQYHYDNKLLDPVLTVFGSLVNPEYDAVKIADGLTNYDIIRISKDSNKMEKIAEVFSGRFIDEFKKDPVKSVEALGMPAKSLFSETIKEAQLGKGKGVGGPVQQVGGAGKCVCPSCGYEEAHDRGTPCAEKDCPKCGTKMKGKK